MAPVRTTSKIAELARNFIDTISSEGQKGWLERISEVVSTRKSTGLLELVEELGTYLTSVEVQQRRKASRLLAELMHRLVFHSLCIKSTLNRDTGEGGRREQVPLLLCSTGSKSVVFVIKFKFHQHTNIQLMHYYIMLIFILY